MKNKNNKKVILVLGAFNPPTIAHVAMGVYLHNIHPDYIIDYVIANNAYLKSSWKNQKSYIDINVRYRLLNFCIDNSYCNATILESQLDGKTYNTVKIYKDNGYEDIKICLGEDKLSQLKKWYNAEKLVSENDFIIFSRDSDKVELPDWLISYKDHFEIINWNKYNGISSTVVRNAWVNGKLDSVKDLLPESVYNYLNIVGTDILISKD